MRPQLRDYQARAIDSLRRNFAAGIRRQLLVAPTGAGKSVMAHEVVAASAEKGRRILFAVNRIQLVNQFSRRLTEAGIFHGIIRGEDTRAPSAPVVVGSIQTIARRGIDAVDVIVIDEAHATPGSKDYRALIAAHPQAAVLGLTATPWAKGMGREFDGIEGPLYQTLVQAASISELIAGGHLVDCECWAPSEPDMKGAQTVRNAFGDMDYSDKAAAERMDKPQLVGDIVSHWERIAKGSNTVVFASSIDHSQHIVQAFRDAGYPAEHISAYTPLEERERIFARHASGETLILSCVALLREGWDCLSEDTEILTPRGWIGIGAISDGDSCYSMNRETREIEETPVLGYVEREVSAAERMVEFSGQHLNLRVTEGHELHVGLPRKAGLHTMTAGEMAESRPEVTIPLAGELSGGFAGLPLTDDEIRLIAWFMTDGCLYRHTLYIDQSQAKAGYVNEIRDLLVRLGLDFRERVREPGRGGFANAKPRHEFSIPRGNGTKRRNGWGKYEQYLDKSVSPLLHEMSRRQFLVLWGEMLKGDGERSGGKAGWLWCCERSQADAWTHMAVIRGLSSSYSTRVTGGGVTMYRVSVRDTDRITTRLRDARATRARFVAPHAGERVWCVRNRNGTLIVRRGGKVSIIGNCPECSTMILARPTRSEIAYVQMAGRVLRPAPGKDKAILIDHTGTVRKLGFPTEDRPMALDDGKPKATSGATDEKELKPCPKCGYVDRYYGLTHTDKRCPSCGFLAVHQRKAVAVADGQLQKLKRADTMQDKQRFWSELLSHCDDRGYSRGWAAHKYRTKFGVWPRGLVDEPIQISPETRSWIRSQQIRWAKAQEKSRAMEAA